MAFVKGQSGNPSGKAKLKLADGRTINDLAREHTEVALNCLVEIMTDPEAPQAAKVTAATSILDRGWGRPAQSVTLSGDASNPVNVRLDLSALTDEQARAIASINIGTPL